MPMQEGFATAALGGYARPPDPPERVEAELKRLMQCTAETEQDVYNGVLYAVGNNHRGTYYPVVVPVIGLLGQVLREGSTWRAKRPSTCWSTSSRRLRPSQVLRPSKAPREHGESKTCSGTKSCA